MIFSDCPKSHFAENVARKIFAHFFKKAVGSRSPPVVLCRGRNIFSKSAGGAKNVPVGRFSVGKPRQGMRVSGGHLATKSQSTGRADRRDFPNTTHIFPAFVHIAICFQVF